MDRIVQFKMPGKLVMGNGAVEQIGEQAKRFNVKKVLVVTDKGILKAGLIDRVVQPLEKAGLQVGIFSDVESDPRIEIVSECATMMKEGNYELIIGVGGGSSIDIAKAAAILGNNPGQIRDYFGIDAIPGPGLPTIMVPTSSGTGSEVTPIAILSDKQEHLKKGVVSDYLYPGIAIVDPLMTLSLPPNVTAFTGMDALTHAIECYTAKIAVPFADTFALESIKLIANNLHTAVTDGKNIEARYNMSLGSLYGGMLLGCVNTAAVHALAYPLGGTFNVSHGVANSLLLPYVMDFNRPMCIDKFARIYDVIGDGEAKSLAEKAVAAVKIITRLSKEVGIPQRLRDIAIPENSIPEMARSAMKVTRLLNNNPREVKLEDAQAIYEQAY